MACLNPFCLFLLPFEWGFDFLCVFYLLTFFDFLMTHLTESCLTEKSELWLPGWMNFPSISRSDIPLTEVNPASTYKTGSFLENRVILLTYIVLFQMLTNLEEVFINCSISLNISTEVPQGQEVEDYYDERMVCLHKKTVLCTSV